MKVHEKGNVLANLVIIGEAPGFNETRVGIPFIGNAGKLLDEIMNTVGLSLEDVLFTNVITKLPKGKITNKLIDDGIPRLKKVLQRVKPSVIICLGGTAAIAIRKMMNKLPSRISTIQGTVENVDNVNILYLHHPSFALKRKERREEIINSIVDGIMKNNDIIEKAIGKPLLMK